MNIDYIPFPGLRPYKVEESKLFFGRERHVSQVISKLEERRFVSVVGNSGSGKSSLVKAGVLPTLLEQSQNWIICSLRPGENPVKELVKSIFNSTVFEDKEFTSDDSNNIYETLKKDRLGLVQIIRPYLRKDKKILILVDQFEELFRFSQLHSDIDSRSKSSHFVELLLAAIEQVDVPIYVMMTLRSDFLGDCEQFDGLPEAINDGQFLVPRMNRSDLHSSITGPINVVNGKISPRLVEQLLNHIGTNADQLPVLQHALMRTYEVWQEKGKPEQPMDFEDYDATGGMQDALSNHAEEAFAELTTKEDIRLAEVIFRTITIKTSDNRGIRRPSTVQSIADISGSKVEDVVRVANVFRRSDRGFIMPPPTTTLSAESILDISHESLMRVWKRLKTWVGEEGESAELYQRITDNALLYEQEKASLWRDPDLQIALDWKDKQRPNLSWANQYNSSFNVAMRFIEASHLERQFSVRDKKRKRKVLFVSGLCLLIALSGLTIWAVSERNNAEINAKNAIAEKGKTEKQAIIAQTNLKKAQEEEKRAHLMQLESEKQKEIALNSADQARLSKTRAEFESHKAILAREQAEYERKIAKSEKHIADKLRVEAELSEAQSKRLSMLSLSQNLAIKSKLADNTTYPSHVKPLLALQAYKFNESYEGESFDSEIFAALFSAHRSSDKTDNYIVKSHTDAVKSICFDPNTGDLASTGNDGLLIIKSRKHAGTVESLQSSLLFSNLSYNEDGSTIALSSDDKCIHIYDKSSIEKPKLVLKDLHPMSINSMSWYKNSLITSSIDNSIRVIDVQTKTVTKELKLKSRPMCIARHLTTLIIGCADGKLYMASLTGDFEAKLFMEINSGKINTVAFNTGGDMLGVGTQSGVCKVIETSNRKIVHTLSGHKGGVTKVVFNPVLNHIATACMDKIVRVYNLDNVASPPILFGDHYSWVLDVQYSPDGKSLSSCGNDKLVITYLIDQNLLIESIKRKTAQNFTPKEWSLYISPEIDYEKTIENL